METINFSGLKYLITFHKLCGNSYFGASVDKNAKNLYLYRVISIVWNLLYIGYTLYCGYEYFWDNIESFNETKSNSSKLSIISILKMMGEAGYYVQTIVINILLIVRGNKILKLFRAQSFKFIDSESESKIGFRIVLIQLVLSLTSETAVVVSEIISSTKDFKLSKYLNHFILYFSNMITISSIISLIAYQSKIISIQFDNICENLSSENLPEMYQFMCRTNRFVKKFDSLISTVIFMNIFNNCIISIVYLSLIAVNDDLLLNMLCLTENLFLIITLCYSCDIIPKRIKKFTHEIQELLSFSTDLNQYLILIKMNLIKRKMGFTALGLMKINSETIISAFALILSYSVIITQTSHKYELY
jgi:hypothetical protein